MKKASGFFTALLLLNLQLLFSQDQLNNIPIHNNKLISYQKIVNQFKLISDVPVEAAGIRDMIIRKEDAVFSLDSGIIYKCKPLNSEITILIFIGAGNFKFSPHSNIEQMQLYRFYEKKLLNENFNSLFLFFADSSVKEVTNQIKFSPAETEGDYHHQLKESMKYLFDEDDFYIDIPAFYTLLEGLNNGFFYAHITGGEDDDLFYVNDPTEKEDISLKRRFNYWFDDLHETICQYSSKKRNAAGEKDTIQDGRINISKYKIDARIEDNLDFSADAQINFTPSFAGQKWAYLTIYSELSIDSILWDDGKKAEFLKGKELSSLWISLDEQAKNLNRSMNIYYHGDLLEKNELSWISIKSPDYWFPRCERRDKSKFDLTFHTPSRYKFCSVGKLVDSKEEDDILTTSWLSEVPIRNASFNIGSFDEYVLELEGLPKVTSYISKGHSRIASYLAEELVLSKRNMEEEIAADVVNSFNLFKNLYGNIPLEDLYISEIPYPHGEAFPGLIHLSWTAFQGIDYEEDLKLLVAHEVAHQWWGIQVDFETYHDQWLSEAFAEYSGAWYMQLALKDNGKFFKKLNSWKKEILTNRKYLFGSGQEAGPVWLGYRTQSKETMGDYQLIIYEKGAWVLHMLRTMLVNLKTMNEDKFTGIMSDFFNSYSGKKATTTDFQRIVEKHLGQDMSWFFKQWIYETAIPDYKLSYKVSQLPDKKFKVRVKVLQENVPPEFRMPMDVLIKFENDQFARVRVELNGISPEFDLPVLPLEPKEIIFNDLNSVLCNLEYKNGDNKKSN